MIKETSKGFNKRNNEEGIYKKSMKTFIKKENSKYYLIPEKSSKLWNKNVFWSKGKLDEIWGRIKNAKSKLLLKIETDLDNLELNINNGDEEQVLSDLMDKNFQKFYHQELTRSNLLEHMADQNKPQLLIKVLADEFYLYDYTYPLHKIAESSGISRNRSILHKFGKYVPAAKRMTTSEIDYSLK